MQDREQVFETPLGWLHDREDRRHLEHTQSPLRITGRVRAPESVDPRKWMRVESADTLSTGCGDALARCLEFLQCLKSGGHPVRLSSRFAYLAAQKMDGLLGRDCGATICGAVKASKVFGICRRSKFRPTVGYSDAMPISAFRRAAAHRVVSHSLLYNYAEVVRILASGVGAALVGIPWAESFDEHDGTIDSISGPQRGYHSLAVVGFVADRRDEQGRKYLIVANSHGRSWGEDGFATVAPRLFDIWGRDDRAMMVGLSDLASYRTRDVSPINVRAAQSRRPAHAPVNHRLDSRQRRRFERALRTKNGSGSPAARGK